MCHRPPCQTAEKPSSAASRPAAPRPRRGRVPRCAGAAAFDRPGVRLSDGTDVPHDPVGHRTARHHAVGRRTVPPLGSTR